MRPVLSVNISIDLGFVVVLEPLSLLLESLLEEDVLLAILVNILQEVDTGLVLTAPLLLTSIPLLLVFYRDKTIDHALMLSRVGNSSLVMPLELLDLLATSQSLLFLVITHSLLSY